MDKRSTFTLLVVAVVHLLVCAFYLWILLR